MINIVVVYTAPKDKLNSEFDGYFSILTFMHNKSRNKIEIYFYCTKTDTSGQEEYSKVMGELSIRNSAKFFRKFARRKSVRKHKIGKGNCLLKTQL